MASLAFLRRPSTAALATGLAAVLLFAAALAGFTAGAGGQTTEGETEEEDDRFVRVRTVYGVERGDHMRVGMQWGSGLDPVLPSTRVLVVEGGEGAAYLPGGDGEAAHVLLETRYPTAEESDWPGRLPGRYGPLAFDLVRPPVYDGKPHVQGLNGDLYDAVDLVVVATRPAGMDDATWEAGSRSLHDAEPSIVTADGTWLAAQDAAVVLAAVAGAVALASLLVPGRPRRSVSRQVPGRADLEHADLEEMVLLQQQAYGFLHQLRTAMRLAGGLLAAGGLGLVVTIVSLGDAMAYQRSDAIEVAINGGSVALWLLGLGIWWRQYRAVARETQRWERTAAPLDA